MIDVVAAVIVRNGRLLLTQRAPEQDHPWLWHCPGGKVRDGESLDHALVREAREELGLSAAWSHFEMAVATLDFTALGAETRRIRWYPVDIGDQKPRPIETVGVGWFSAGDLCSMAASSGPSWRRQFRFAMLTEPTERVLPVLLEHLRRCASTPASLPSD